MNSKPSTACVFSFCLQLEKNPDRRAAILEDMPHKTAANVLIYLSYLDDLEQQRLEMMQIEADAAAANEASVTFGACLFASSCVRASACVLHQQLKIASCCKV